MKESQTDARQVEKLDKLLFQYVCVRSRGRELGWAIYVEHDIHLTSDVPIKLPHRLIPPKCMTEVKAHIKAIQE